MSLKDITEFCLGGVEGFTNEELAIADNELDRAVWMATSEEESDRAIQNYIRFIRCAATIAKTFFQARCLIWRIVSMLFSNLSARS